VQGVAKYTKAHIVVLLIHGGPLDVSWLQQSDRVGAILTSWYPGQVSCRPVYDVMVLAACRSSRPAQLKQQHSLVTS
jgi:Glycosyl hydrolase family 3 C-terminal domain